ncbi:hypothetical protein EC991_007499 [Linnemannia zychae]|nr:hypothetical protein EC991_007499 [Linnemannia zychae]
MEITIENQQQHLRSTIEAVRRRPPSPYPLLTNNLTIEESSSFYSTPQRTPTTATHSKQSSYNPSEDYDKHDLLALDHAVPSTPTHTNTNTTTRQTLNPPPPPPSASPPPSPSPNSHLDLLSLDQPTLSEILQETPMLIQTLIQKRAVVGDTEKMIDIMDVDDTFDEQYNPVISAYQSSQDLFKNFPASSLAPPQQSQQEQYPPAFSPFASMPPISLPPPPRGRRYPIPLSDPQQAHNITIRTQALNSLPLSPFEKNPSASNFDLSPTTPTPATNINDRNASDDQVDLTKKQVSIAQWAQEQAAIEEHRLEQQRRSQQVRSYAKDELQKSHGHGLPDTSIHSLKLTKKSSRRSLGNDDHPHEDASRDSEAYNTSTFGPSGKNMSSTPLKVLLEKDDDDSDNDHSI